MMNVRDEVEKRYIEHKKFELEIGKLKKPQIVGHPVPV